MIVNSTKKGAVCEGGNSNNRKHRPSSHTFFREHLDDQIHQNAHHRVKILHKTYKGRFMSKLEALEIKIEKHLNPLNCNIRTDYMESGVLADVSVPDLCRLLVSRPTAVGVEVESSRVCRHIIDFIDLTNEEDSQERCEMDDSSDILQDIPPIVLKEFINNLKNDFPAALHDTFNGSIYVQDEEAAKMLLDALMKTQKIPYQNVKITNLSGLTDSAFTIMENLTTTPEWCTTKEPLFYLPWSTAQKMEVDLPEGVEIQYLTKEHASKIDTFWPYRFPGSKELIEDMIDLNFGLGIFKDEALISWALVWYYGGIGSVHTLEEERRKGYGRAVVQAITKKMGNMEIDVHVLTVEDNTSGENFFKALGFKYGLTTFCRWRPNPWPLPLYN